MEIKKAVRNATCVACGAQVPIYSRASVQAVCPFCRSTLVRTDMHWDSVGQMAALADDLSPFFVGMRGKYKQTGFTIIGRLQQQFDEGVWNEWLLQLDNNRTSWLGEGSGLFYLTVPSTSTESLPEFSSLSLGQMLTLDGSTYCVSNIERASCIATDGEIPFAATPGESAHFVDLVGEDGSFASLDYSDDSPKLYTGKTVSLDEIECESRDGKPLKQLTADALRCAACGNAVSKRNPASLLVACISCGCANNVSNSGKLVVAYSQNLAKLRPNLTLGSSGIVDGYSYEVIGFIRMTGGGDIWDEYLLYSAARGICWLVCSQGHWSLMRPSSAPSVFNGNISFKNKNYKHFATYQGSVVAVLGEFYWQVKRGDSAKCSDFICPPYVISSEKSAKEITWSEGEYIDSAIISAAFNVEEPRKKGNGINQPSPSILGYVSAFLLSMVLVLLVDMFIHPKSFQTIKFDNLALTSATGSPVLVSEPFTLKASHRLFQVHTNTNLNNDWVGLEFSLINQDTGETRLMSRELAFYSGHDSDGYWSEGSTNDDASFANVKAGTYVLEVNADASPITRQNISAHVSVTHGEPSSKNFWFVFILLAIGPVLAGFNKYYFEKRRWDASDHPWGDE